MIGSLLYVARRHIILFGTAKFAAGLVIGFGLGVYFLPILTAEKGLDSDVLIELKQAQSVAAHSRVICRGRTPFIGVMAPCELVTTGYGWRDRYRPALIAVCI